MKHPASSKRLTWASATVLLSSILLFFLLFIWGIFVQKASAFGEALKEEIQMTVFLTPSTNEASIYSLQKDLQSRKEIRSVDFISREDALEEFDAMAGSTMMGILDMNPLFDALKLSFYSEFLSPKEIGKMEFQLLKEDIVEDIVYDKGLMVKLAGNIERIHTTLLVLSLLFLVVAVLLIHNFIRLQVYAKRFSIRTMQLVGATAQVVRRPFITNGIGLGVLAGILGTSMGIFSLHSLHQMLPNMHWNVSRQEYLTTAAVIIAFSMLLFFFSAFHAVRKYLHAKLSELYI